MYPIVLDNFLKQPELTRQAVLDGGFVDLEFQGTIYKTVNVKDGMEDIKPSLETLFNRPIELQIAAWRQNKEGSQLHSLVHADNSCAQMASVLYLNLPEQCRGGTAFWRHKKTGWVGMPTQEELDKSGYTIEQMNADWNDADAWQQIDVVQMRFNRLVVYPTQMFHSRWPWSGFGDTDEDARLIGAFFYNIL